MPAYFHSRPARIVLLATVGFLLGLSPANASAATQTREEASDAPSSASGKADLRKVVWSIGATSASLTVALDASTTSVGRASIGVRMLLDTDGDGIADRAIVANRNPDGVRVDVALRVLARTQSTADCQDLDGTDSQPATLSTTLGGDLESFTYTFDPSATPGGLAAFRWAAFAQAPDDPALSGPWETMPNAANPQPTAANPGDRRCDSGKTGVSVRMSGGVAFPDPAPKPADSDGDGLPNTQDQCPAVSDAGKQRMPRTGCPADPTPTIGGSGEAGSVKVGKKGNVTLPNTVSCSIASAPPCDVTVTPTTAKSVQLRVLTSARKKKAKIVLGKGHLQLQPGTSAKVKFKLSKKGRKVLKRQRKLRVLVAVVVKDAAGKTAAKAIKVTLKAHKKK